MIIVHKQWDMSGDKHWSNRGLLQVTIRYTYAGTEENQEEPLRMDGSQLGFRKDT